eukprot:1755592-Prymnesium_polylepis.1
MFGSASVEQSLAAAASTTTTGLAAAAAPTTAAAAQTRPVVTILQIPKRRPAPARGSSAVFESNAVASEQACVLQRVRVCAAVSKRVCVPRLAEFVKIL